ncbi:MAG TPA: helix-turn-helix transcriptional regulator [Caulobacteraceae bacterium]|nr:helix-turn-helix transcriptional regulator [Caulobacteraceae bacterium]
MANLTAAACRAARGILKWSVRDLAREAGVSPTTVNLLEAERPYRGETAEKIVEAFEANSVEITNERGSGARLAFFTARPHQREDGSWAVLAHWKAGDPAYVLTVKVAAREADDAEVHDEAYIAKAMRRAIDGVLRQTGDDKLSAGILPQLRGSWRLQEAPGVPGLFTATEQPPGGGARSLTATLDQVAASLRAEGCIPSRYDPTRWWKP